MCVCVCVCVCGCLITRSMCGWMHQRWLSTLGLIPTKNKECCLLLTTPKLTFPHREVYFSPKASMSIGLLNFRAFFNGFRGCGTTFSPVRMMALVGLSKLLGNISEQNSPTSGVSTLWHLPNRSRWEN